MPYVTNDKVRIHYEVIGDGPPLFLHHGFTQSMRRWHFHGYVEALKADNQLILIDARGHGKSDKPHDTEMYAFPAMANDALAVLNELGIQQTRYWGFSMEVVKVPCLPCGPTTSPYVRKDPSCCSERRFYH